MAKRTIFQYAGFCESNFKRNMANNGVEIDTTFCSDLSIAEFCEVYMSDRNAVEDTVKRVLEGWKNNEHYLTQFLIAFGAKSLEHHTMTLDKYAGIRQFTVEKHKEYMEYYSKRFYELRDTVLEQFKEDPETHERIINALD